MWPAKPKELPTPAIEWRSEMIIFESLSTTLRWASFFWSRWGSNENLRPRKTIPPSLSLSKLKLWKTVKLFIISKSVFGNSYCLNCTNCKRHSKLRKSKSTLKNDNFDTPTITLRHLYAIPSFTINHITRKWSRQYQYCKRLWPLAYNGGRRTAGNTKRTGNCRLQMSTC